MTLAQLLLALTVLSIVGYLFGRQRASKMAGGDSRKLHSRPNYYGWNVAISGLLPALIVVILGLFAVANGIGSISLVGIIAIIVCVLGLLFGIAQTKPEYRARNVVENALRGLLILSASIAILTTIAIVLSLFFESMRFFSMYPALDFFFGTNWAPNFHGNSELGFLPILWGTLYISVIALIVAVPVGLFSAIYLSEYAPPIVRSIVKPLLEVLAGVPTIVYGLFALTVFGPMLFDMFGDGAIFDFTPAGDGRAPMKGVRSAMTAGVVMGIMLIPFVSSLSDDIINAVPQAMRDGSYGLGATHAETMKQVILPAALPGIVGAFLLAASRAIGETMIVVLGAGAMSQISGNPLEAMTTITTRIVAQLTGDGDFSSPETLVAFALGLTLFALTLALNVYALHIVRKYREQYE